MAIIIYGKCSKISNTFSFYSQIICGYKGWNSPNACQNSKQGRSWSGCFFRSSLIWVYSVCLGLFGRQLVFRILEHLSYAKMAIIIYGKCSKISNTYSFCSEIICGYRGWNSPNACQNSKQGRPWSDCSDLRLLCLSRPFSQATSVQNFRTFMICYNGYVCTHLILICGTCLGHLSKKSSKWRSSKLFMTKLVLQI